jgi:amino acid transporter
VLVLAVAALLIYGVRDSARFNTVMVFAKVAVLIFFVVVGFSFSTATTSRRGRRAGRAAPSTRPP